MRFNESAPSVSGHRGCCPVSSAKHDQCAFAAMLLSSPRMLSVGSMVAAKDSCEVILDESGCSATGRCSLSACHSEVPHHCRFHRIRL